MELKKRTPEEMKAYIEGYNACNVKFKEYLQKSETVRDAIKMMDVFAAALNEIIYKKKSAAWVPIDQEPHEIYECNVCGWLLYNEDRTDFKYCPNCGRKMEGDSE